uniref:Large ribosomal subunit protein mL38 n=1 Tax=Mesocestoides corti TaxID=53468 RepID=A0A5K3F2A1_MESCO
MPNASKVFRINFIYFSDVAPAQQSLEPVDIGFKFDPPKRTHKIIKRPELEPLARRKELKVKIDEVHNADEDVESPIRRSLAACHYGIFSDLFGPPHQFNPVVDLPIFYPLANSSDVIPVFCGNYVSPENAMDEPLVDLSRLTSNSLWTLIMTCPDEPLPDESDTQPAEYIHWMITNISSEVCADGAPKSGDVVVEYLPPLPYCGTGFHRYVFVLYRQDNGVVDLSGETRGPVNVDQHSERVFSTADFYRKHQDALTPAGLAFFQSSWNTSVRSYIREHLPLSKELVFGVEFPDDLPPPQSRFPLANSWFHPRRHPCGLPLADSRLGVHEDVSFDVYLDRYRDRREMDEELVKLRLATEGNPLDATCKRTQSPFPLASPPLPSDREVPSWWRQQEIQRRLRKGRWAQLEGHED